MFRGFRWQLLAFIIAAAAFALSFVLRSNDDERLPQLPTLTVTTQAVVPTPTPIPVQQETTPLTIPATSAAQVVASSTQNTAPIFREALIGSVRRLNPLFADLNPVDRDITSLIFEGLVRINEFGEPVPALAREWTISPDGREYVMVLRDDVLWHDGIPFSAADVTYTMAMLRSQDFPGSAELAAFWRTVETEQLGDHLIRFRLTQPLASFLDALRIGILPAHALEGTPAAQLANHPFNLSPIGTGPYQLEALRANTNATIETVELRVSPNYRQRPEGQQGFAIDRIHFQIYESFDVALQAFQSGGVDGLAARNRNERGILRQVNGTLHSALEPTVGMLIFNWVDDDVAFFREQRVRQALEVGLNRAQIIERHLSNLAVAANSPLLPGSWAYVDIGTTPYNPDLARQLLATANIPQPEDETDTAETDEQDTLVEEAGNQPSSEALLTFSLLIPDDESLRAIANEIQAQWALYGVDVQLDVQNETTYQERLSSAEFDAAIVELSLGGSADPDVYMFWDQGQFPDGKNYGGVDDRGISEWLERARRDPNGLNRVVHYANFQREFAERSIAIPLYYPLFSYITAPHIENVQLPRLMSRPADRFLTLQDWTLTAN